MSVPGRYNRRHQVCALLLVATLGTAMAQNGPRPCLDSCEVQERRGDYSAAMASVQRAVRLATETGDTLSLARALLRTGMQAQRTSDLNAALENYLSALRLFEAIDDAEGQAQAHNHIGTVHHYDEDQDKAADHYRRALAIWQRMGDPEKLALPYNNLGALLEDNGMPDSALYYHRLGLALRETGGDPVWIGVAWSHIGLCHDQAGRTDSALFYLERAQTILREKGSKSTLGHVRRMLGIAHLHAGRPAEARRWCQDALAFALAAGSRYQEQQTCECLYKANAALGHHAEAYAQLLRSTTLRDSLFGAERARERTRIELTHEFERQQLADSLVRADRQRNDEILHASQLGREREQKRVWFWSSIGVLALAIALWNRLYVMRRSRNTVRMERERSDGLLRNILPGPIAEELKAHGRARAREVEGVSILFTDFNDFTKLSEQMDAQALVGEIDACFKVFDAICLRHGIEKIKTIGDAYMCAGGLPASREGSAESTVRAALEMQDAIERRAAERSAAGLPAFRMRAGIHTGTVVAGIVGDTKFQYDLWGDAVNIAARMESASEVGRVNISAATFALVKDAPGLSFAARGGVHAKGKGELAMFFVEPDRGES